MKKIQLVLVLLLVFLLGMMIATLLFHYGVVVKAQEGCGEWVEVWQETYEDTKRGIILDAKCCFKWFSAHYPDSVWVPKSCVPIEWDTVWDYLSTITDTLIIPPRQMTIEEKVDMLFDMVQSLTAEVNYLKATGGTVDSSVRNLYMRRGDSTWRWNPETKEWEKSK